LILISDASILIDLGLVDGIDLLPKLGECEVLDLVLMECEHPSQPGLVRTVKESGILVVPVLQALLNEAASLQAKFLSIQDKLTLCYAKHRNGIVLAGDRPLQDLCQEMGIEYRGANWVIEESHRLGLIDREELYRWIQLGVRSVG
jgi:hypothetical protein